MSLSLLVCLSVFIPETSAASATTNPVTWTKVNIPAAGSAGKWVLAPGSDVRQLVAAMDGSLYAAVAGLTYSLFRSSDGGRSLAPAGKVSDDIVALATSPADANLVYYATDAAVFRSKNGGSTFEPLPAGPGGAGADGKETTSLSVARADSNIVAVGVRDTDSAEFGGIYTLNEADVIPAWADTGLGAFDVWAVAFSPAYSADRELVAAVTDETDSYVFTRVGDGLWNADIAAARLQKDGTGPVVIGQSAAIAFPGDYNGSGATGSDLYVGVATGSGDGDVFRVSAAEAPGVSPATDLNVGATYGADDIDITGLCAGSENNTTVLLAGAADAHTYVSVNSGASWTRSRKTPTGSSVTTAILAPDFATTGRMYVATTGTESAVSISENGGASWDQISLIDTGLDALLDLAPSPSFDQDSTLFLLTYGGVHSLWRSMDAGTSWERVLCGNLSAGEVMARVAVAPTYGSKGQSVFIAGESGGSPAVWESTDNGQTFRRRFTRDPDTGEPFNIDAWVVTGQADLIISGYDGSRALLYLSSSSGFTYGHGTPVGNLPLCSLAVSPDFNSDQAILAADSGGQVYLSQDGGLTFNPIPPLGTPPVTGAATAIFDPGFKTNHTIYAANDAAGAGIYRFVIGSSDAWQEIDSSAPSAARFTGLAASGNGTLYAVSSAAGGGMERSIEPRSSSGATFETVTGGLDKKATLLGLWSAGSHLWSIDSTGNALLSFNDTLTSAAAPVSPDDGAGGLGTLVDHQVRDVRLDWQALDGATGYEWQCNYENDFSDIPAGLSGSVSASMVRLPDLEPGTTYYWRVRASAPVYGPWSEKRSFTTGLDTELIALGPQSPAPGATGVQIEPFFQWTAVAGAEGYELLVSANVDFAAPLVSRSLPTNAWQCDIALENAATYYWKVRAISQNTRSSWGATAVFTTEPEVTPAPPTTELDHEITPTPPTPTTTPEGTVAALRLAATEPAATTQISMPAAIDGYYNLPIWVIYLIAALVVTVILALVVVLAMVQKIRH